MIFVDTWGWLALGNRRDQYHAMAVEFRRGMPGHYQWVTSDFVLSETISQIHTALGSQEGIKFVDKLLLACKQSNNYRLIHVSRQQFDDAWEMKKKYSDKPDISFVDFTSMIVMKDLAITDVFTGDAHFSHVGMGFRLRPENV